MSAPQEFIEAFLREKSAVYAETNTRLEAIHTKYFDAPLLKEAATFLMRDPTKAIVEEVKHGGASATVITRETAPRGTVLRQRYRLVAEGRGWKLADIDRECFFCRGTGRAEGIVCPKCNGEGWHKRAHPTDDRA